jgi:methyl-accepting chemotaxis protein
MKTISIKLRLLASNLGAIAFVVLVGGIGYFAVTRLDAAMDRSPNNGVTMKDQMAADQVHDALRADVLAALLAGPDGNAEERDTARRDSAEHIALFRKLMADIDKEATDPALRAAVGKVRPDVDAYLQSAEATVALALSDVAAARQAHPAFMAHFRKLEKSMGELSELIEAASTVTRDAGDATVSGPSAASPSPRCWPRW